MKLVGLILITSQSQFHPPLLQNSVSSVSVTSFIILHSHLLVDLIEVSPPKFRIYPIKFSLILRPSCTLYITFPAIGVLADRGKTRNSSEHIIQ
jgi:hypothetical protein